MGARAIGVFLFILCLSASATMMNGSGMSSVLGVSPDTGIEDDVNNTIANQSQEEFESNRPDVADYLGYAVSGVTYFLDIFVVLGPVESALRNIGFPKWFVFPVMNLVTRPIYFLAAFQMIRGVMVE
jgi:hypothetical protein